MAEVASLDPAALAKWSGGAWLGALPERAIGLSNDTRTLRAGELFCAFASGTRDGHDFLEVAKAAGASGAVVKRAQPEIDLPQLVVHRVEEALIEMAAAFRRTWRQNVVGVTGSCGKTTCKELLALALGPERTLSTKGNLNNLIGVPMSILRAEALATRFAVLEAGISEPGEMGQLARMIDPELAVFTSIGPAHLEGLGSECKVASEKGLLAQGARVRQVFAGETCERYAGYLGGIKVRLVKPDARLEAEWGFRWTSANGQTALTQKIFGQAETFRYRGVGKALASNVALSVAVAASLGVGVGRVQAGLDAWSPPKLRGEWRIRGAARAYLDCYNANPLSMNDALETFVASSRAELPRLFILGCMEELGPMSASYHEELGIEMPFRKEDFLLVLGAHASSVLLGMKNVGHDMDHCQEIDAIDAARERVAGFEGDIFLKGSRRYRLEDALGEGFAPLAAKQGEDASC